MSEIILRHGEVIALADGRVRVRLDEDAGCGACASRGACASGGGSGGKSAPTMEFAAPAGVRAGDRVTLAVAASSLTAAALLGYLLPPVCLLAGAVAASLAWGSDGAAVLGGSVGLGAGLLVARLASARVVGSNFSQAACRPNFEPGEQP